MFAMGAIRSRMQDSVQAYENKLLDALKYEGEYFINQARANGTYKDQTGNLRASIGYVILKDGKEIFASFIDGGTKDGKKIAKRESERIIQEVVQTEYRGYVLIGIAGMSYAAAVESKGYDVITGSAPVDQDLKELFRAIKL